MLKPMRKGEFQSLREYTLVVRLGEDMFFAAHGDAAIVREHFRQWLELYQSLPDSEPDVEPRASEHSVN